MYENRVSSNASGIITVDIIVRGTPRIIRNQINDFPRRFITLAVHIAVAILFAYSWRTQAHARRHVHGLAHTSRTVGGVGNITDVVPGQIGPETWRGSSLAQRVFACPFVHVYFYLRRSTDLVPSRLQSRDRCLSAFFSLSPLASLFFSFLHQRLSAVCKTAAAGTHVTRHDLLLVVLPPPVLVLWPFAFSSRTQGALRLTGVLRRYYNITTGGSRDYSFYDTSAFLCSDDEGTAIGKRFLGVARIPFENNPFVVQALLIFKRAHILLEFCLV